LFDLETPFLFIRSLVDVVKVVVGINGIARAVHGVLRGRGII
jgi:hypothetical protein